MKISFGDVLLTRFPYTDLTGDKRRPALVLSANNSSADVIVCAVTSRRYEGRYDIPVQPTSANGLKAPSWVQFDKIATLERGVIAGRMGVMPSDFMEDHSSLFITLFGFATK